jgi:hypothetical protein
MGDEIFRYSGKDPLENVRCISIAFSLQVCFPKQPVSLKVLGVGLKDVSAMRDSLIELITLNQAIYFFNICA